MSRIGGAKTLALVFMAGVAGGYVGIAITSWLADGPKILGASWWELMTAFGTVGAVAAAVGLEIVRRCLERKRRAVLAGLRGPMIVAKLLDLEGLLLRLVENKMEVSATLINSSEERATLRSWLKDLQQTFTEDDVDLLVDFELQAAELISVANASLEHCIVRLKQLNPKGEKYPSELVLKFYEALELALNAVQGASEHAARWPSWK